jgi:CBS domain-containing protein
MTIIDEKTMLRELLVKDAMRVQVIGVTTSASILAVIRRFIKFKVAAVLVLNEVNTPVGVVSKTDVMGAYYAELPKETPVSQIMTSPPLFCAPGDAVEHALDVMRRNRVYRLYVREEHGERVIGALAYPDIVGLLYRYCRECERSLMSERRTKLHGPHTERLKVKDVMTTGVTSLTRRSSLSDIMEALSVNRFGAVLITDEAGTPSGVISKTDLIFAYKRDLPVDTEAGAVLTSDLRSCDREEFIEDAIRSMIFSEVRRLFVRDGAAENIVGVFSLSDAARIRSGSCHACVAGRIKVGDG